MGRVLSRGGVVVLSAGAEISSAKSSWSVFLAASLVHPLEGGLQSSSLRSCNILSLLNSSLPKNIFFNTHQMLGSQRLV